MKYFVTFSLIIFFASAGLAEIYLRDVPEGHWATDAVYELVKRGVTSGYPDGTFRGKKNISRYEIASFLSKFARSFKRSRGKREKLLEELKSELALIKYKRAKTAETQFRGEIESRARVSTTLPRGGKIDYRLKLNLIKNFDPKTSFKIGLDTMDAGYDCLVPRSLSTELLDFEGRIRNLKVVIGPGIISHRDSSGLVPSEDRMVFERPFTAIEASSKIRNAHVLVAYVARGAEVSGKVGVHEITGRLEYNFNEKLRLAVQPRYFFETEGRRDLRGEMTFDFMPDKRSRTYLFLGVGSVRDGTSGGHVRGIQEWRNLFGWGLDFTLRGDKIGSRYRSDLNRNELYFLNNFNRPILDGTVDLGWKINQKLSDKLSLEGKGDYVATGSYKYGEAYPGTYLLWQLGVTYRLTSNFSLDAFYRSYSVPSGIAQFSDPVPKLSELVGIRLKGNF